MKHIITALLAIVCTTTQAQNYTITRIVDGDTVAIHAPFLPPPLKPELLLRIYGIDTPEKSWRAQCTLENELGERATQFTHDAITNAKTKSATIMEWDKYGGRVLGDVVYDGKSLRQQLIQNNLAREYYGTKKESWCK